MTHRALVKTALHQKVMPALDAPLQWQYTAAALAAEAVTPCNKVQETYWSSSLMDVIWCWQIVAQTIQTESCRRGRLAA